MNNYYSVIIRKNPSWVYSFRTLSDLTDWLNNSVVNLMLNKQKEMLIIKEYYSDDEELDTFFISKQKTLLKLTPEAKLLYER